MADGIINIIKPIVIQKLTEEIIKNKENLKVVDGKIDDIIAVVRTKIDENKALFDTVITTINIFGDAKTTFKTAIENIDLSELENNPEIPNQLQEVKELPGKVKIKLVELIDELIPDKSVSSTTAKAPTTAPTAEVATTAPTTAPTAEVATTTVVPAPEVAATATVVPAQEVVATATVVPAAEVIQAGLNTLSDSQKEEVIKNIMELLNKSGVLEEIKKQICTAPPATPIPAPPPATPIPAPPPATQVLPPAPPAGGANKKNRRKTKKNIRRPNKSYTKFGRTF